MTLYSSTTCCQESNGKRQPLSSSDGSPHFGELLGDERFNFSKDVIIFIGGHPQNLPEAGPVFAYQI